MILIQEAPFDPAVELAAMTKRSPAAGAVAAFVGLVRPSAGEAAVECLELQQYEKFTRSTVESIAADEDKLVSMILGVGAIIARSSRGLVNQANAFVITNQLWLDASERCEFADLHSPSDLISRVQSTL